MIPGIGLSEIIVIFVVLLLVVGPHKLPEVARTIGRMISRLKQASYEFKRALYLDELRDEVYQPVKDWNPTQEVKQFVDQVAQETFSPDSSSPSSSDRVLENSPQEQDSHSSNSVHEWIDDDHLNDDQHEDHLGHHHVDSSEYHATPFATAVSHSQHNQLKATNTHPQKEQNQEEIDDEDDNFEASVPSQDPLMANVTSLSNNENQTTQNTHNMDLDHDADSKGDSV